MTTKEATARPWALSSDQFTIYAPNILGTPKIASVCSIRPSDESEANAQLIVTAVNSHDTLTEENARLSIRVKEMEEALEKIATRTAAPSTATTIVQLDRMMRDVRQIARTALEQSK